MKLIKNDYIVQCTNEYIKNQMIKKWGKECNVLSITKFDFPKSFSVENKKYKGSIVTTEMGNLFITDSNIKSYIKEKSINE